MTKENFKFIRRLTEDYRIRMIGDSNRRAYSSFFRSDEDYINTYRGENMVSFGIEADGVPAGAMELVISDESIEIAHICVDENRRRRGLGSALLVKAKEYTMEQGFETAGAGVSEDDVAIRAFFSENGFFMSAEMEEYPVMVWMESSELDETLSGDREEVEKAAGEVYPMEAILVPMLERLKGFIRSEGFDSEIVAGDRLFLDTDCDTYDIQISYRVLDASFNDRHIVFNSFIEYEGSPDEAQALCSEINSRSFFVAAFPMEGGIDIRYTVAEGTGPLEETVFLAAFSEYRHELELAFSRVG